MSDFFLKIGLVGLCVMVGLGLLVGYCEWMARRQDEKGHDAS